MKRLPGIALLFALGCADTNAELPPVEFGGGSGARLMTGSGRTPVDSYEIAYAQLTKQHLNVRRCLEPRGRNLYGAALSMESILDALRTMRSLVTPAHQSRLEKWIVQYAEWKRAVERDTWGGSFLQDFEFSERRVKEAFDISTVEIVPAFPGAAAKEPPPASRPGETAPAPKATEPAIPSDKVVPPAGAPPPTVEPPRARPAEKPPEAVPVPAGSGAIYYKAWEGFHNDLANAYKATPRPDCRPKYDALVESLKLLKATLPADRAQKLQIYLDFYGGLNEKTKTFTVLPDKTTEKEILNELEVISGVVRREFNPDR